MLCVLYQQDGYYLLQKKYSKMPELPEVETIARQLNEALSGRVVSRVLVYREKNFLGQASNLVGKKVACVFRKAKTINIEFESGEEKVVVHLKMTGQLIFVDGDRRVVGGHPTSDWVKSLPSKHTRIEIVFEDGSTLFFNDMRAFGWMKLITNVEYGVMMKDLPPDVVDDEFDIAYLSKALAKYKRPVKIVLLDQQLMGGIGNIYANDALNMAKILPTRKANELNKGEISELYRAVRWVIDLGIKTGGASAANYVDTKGLGGTYQNYFLTYKRDGQPCKNCGEKIVKMKQGGRGTFYCANCQK